MEIKLTIGDDGSLSVDVDPKMQTFLAIGVLEVAKNLIIANGGTSTKEPKPTEEV